MQCEDNSKLRTPLSEVCQTTDIGCVPITDGAPTCTPQPDELPVAFDPKTTTLWLFSCKTREWIPFQKFTMCQLDALNLENITNICDVLNIGVNYAGSGECQQGTITLRELAERILECLTLETKIITIGQGDGNKLKIFIEGLPLDPVYVTGRNIWSEGGSGTETDPLLVATYDPICKWDIKTQAQVDAAATKHLGACLDGEMSRVPFPPKICELPSRNQAQVDNAQSVELAACVDGEGAKIPYIKPSPPVCEAPNLTLAETQAAQSSLKLVACKADGDSTQTVKIPIDGTGFFSYNTDWKYMCVPLTDGYPNGAPAEGTGPLRVDCSGNLFVWLCDQNRWQIVKDGIEGLPFLNENNVPDICNNLRMKGWYSNNADPCVQDVQMSLAQLAANVISCGLLNPTVVTMITDAVLDEIKKSKNCKKVFSQSEESAYPRNGSDRSINIQTANLITSKGDYNFHGEKAASAVFSFRKQNWEEGSGTIATPVSGSGVAKIDLEANANCDTVFSLRVSCQIVLSSWDRYANGLDYGVCLIAGLTEDRNVSWEQFAKAGYYSPNRYMAVANWHSRMTLNAFGWTGNTNNTGRTIRGRASGTCMTDTVVSVEAGKTESLYLQGFLVIHSNSVTSLSTAGDGAWLVDGCSVHCDVRKFRPLYI